MATLTQRTHVVEEKTDRLETVFAAFMARSDAFMARTEESMARTDAFMARTGESMARTDAAVARTDESIGRLERIVERREREGARERKEMNKRWGELANKTGTLVEDIVAPSIRRLAREVFDCGEERHFATRVSLKRSDDPSRQREFDALYVGADAVLLNDTKSTPRREYVREFVQFVESGEFALYFPQYAHLPIRPAFSSLSIPPDVVTLLTRQGIYAIAMGDEAMHVVNLEAVRSRRPARPA